MAKINEAKGGVADRSFIDIIEIFINSIINHLQKEFYIKLSEETIRQLVIDLEEAVHRQQTLCGKGWKKH